jgi:hypothetical protein
MLAFFGLSMKWKFDGFIILTFKARIFYVEFWELPKMTAISLKMVKVVILSVAQLVPTFIVFSA